MGQSVASIVDVLAEHAQELSVVMSKMAQKVRAHRHVHVPT